MALDVQVGFPGNSTPPIDRLIMVAKMNEDQGVDSLWWPDHLMSLFPQSLWSPDIADIAKYQKSPHVHLDAIAAMAVAGQATTRIKIASGVTESFRRHPAMIAQEFLTLDHITKGRVILGIGAGERENIEPYGIEYKNQASRLEEAIRIIRLLWESDQPVDFDGRFWKLKGAVVGLGPYQPAQYPPIWIGAHGARMLEITGRLADGWCPISMDLEEYREKLMVIRRVAKENGRDPNAITPCLQPFTVVDKDHETCHKLLESPLVKALCLLLPSEAFEKLGYEHPIRSGFYGLKDYIPDHYSRQELLDIIARIPREVPEHYFFHGTPEDIVQTVENFAKVGLKHVVFWNMTFFGDITKLAGSYGLLYEVIRYIKGLA